MICLAALFVVLILVSACSNDPDGSSEIISEPNSNTASSLSPQNRSYVDDSNSDENDNLAFLKDEMHTVSEEELSNISMTWQQAIDLVVNAIKDTTELSNIGFNTTSIVEINGKYYFPVKQYGISKSNPEITTKMNWFFVDVETEQVYLLEDRTLEGGLDELVKLKS